MASAPAAEQRRDQAHPPDQERGEQRRAGRPRRPTHDPRLRRLERQDQAERHRGDQVDPQDLRGGHRHGEAEQDRDDHGQDLAAVGRQGPGDHLADVVVDRASFVHRRDDRGEVVVQKHHLGCLLRRLRALAPHGDADVGLLERRRIVDAVAGHRHDGALGLQRAHDAQLVLRAGAREHVGPRSHVHEAASPAFSSSAPVMTSGASAMPSWRAIAAAVAGVIAGDHLHGDAGGAAFGDGGDGLLAGRVDEADDAEEDQVDPDPRTRAAPGRRWDASSRTPAPARLPTRPARSAPPSMPGPEAARRPARLGHAHLEQALGRPLTKIARSPFGALCERRHEPVRASKGISSRRGHSARACSGLQPAFMASATSAPSIGSPSTTH